MFKCFQSNYNPQKASTYQLQRYKYQDIELIAEGGYSFVWHAKSKSLSYKVACKKILLQSNDVYEMAQKEIKVLRSLPDHPNIIKLIDYGEILINNKRIICIVTEYCETTLSAILSQQILSEQQIKDFFSQILDGIEFIHAEGYTHRDIKLENVLVLNGLCKICDFGSVSDHSIDLNALSNQELYQQEEIFSKQTTIIVRPPEMTDVLTRQVIDQKVDLWQLGCLLYTLCFRKLPFKEDNKIAIAQAIFEIPKSNISLKTLTIIQSLLQVDPKKRPTIKDLKLSLYLEDQDEWGEFQ